MFPIGSRLRCGSQRGRRKLSEEFRQTRAGVNVPLQRLIGLGAQHVIARCLVPHGASLLGANLFRADLTKIEVDDATVMAEANLTHARIQKTGRPRGAS